MRTWPNKLAILIVLCCSSLAALAQTTVEAFSPTGTVKKVRQATARFSAQMVAFGDLRLEAPFSVDCPVPGAGRWIDGSNWSYDFERDLPAGLTCRFTLKPDRKDLAGQPLAGERQFNFTTGGPAIVESLPRDGTEEIDEQQIFVLGLDALATDASIEANAYCRADGINEKIDVRLVSGAEREQVLELRKSFVDRYLNIYFRARGMVWRSTIPMRARRSAEMPIAVVQCKRTLPPGAGMSLVWGAGIATASGIATDGEQALAYRTRRDFSAKFSCDRVKAKAPCIPFLPMRLELSAPIRIADAKAILLAGAGGKLYPAAVEKNEERNEFVSAVTFAGPFPESARFQVRLPAGLKDDAGRALLNQSRFPLEVRTDAQPPLVKFAAPFGIIESRGDRMLPVTVRNVEAGIAASMRSFGSVLRVADQQDAQVIGWLKQLSSYGSWQAEAPAGDALKKPLLAKIEGGALEKFVLPKPNGRRAFEVIGIPLRKNGFYVAELASPRLGAAINKGGGTAYVRSSALVTNLAAHFKHGAQSSLVWVTSLDKGKPVATAKIAVRDCDAKLLWEGTTGADGVAHIAQELPPSQCSHNSGYFVSARSGGDFTFTLSEWQRGIESWRFNLPTAGMDDDNTIAATVFDRTLLRAGETVHMKHFLRKHTQAGIALVGPGDKRARENWRMRELGIVDQAAQPSRVFLVHQGSNEKVALALKWDAAGSAATDWKIPAEAKLGSYVVMIGGEQAGSFRVEQFRVPTMRAVLSGPKTPAIQPARLDIDAQVIYLSGGGASFAPVKLRTVVEEKAVSFPDYEDFTFNAADIKEGTVKDTAVFDDNEGSVDEGDGEHAAAAVGTVRTQSLALDKAGGARIVLDQLPKVEAPRELLAELSYQDANGETLSASTRIPLWPSSYVVGIQPDGWLLSKDSVKFKVVVLDLAGKPVMGAPVDVDFYERANYSHRRRLIGGFYAYENTTEVKRLGPACAGTTDKYGLLLCEGKAPAGGDLVLRARTADGEQRAAISTRDVWVAGSADWWFNVTDNDRIDLLPSKKRFEPGEQASFQVRSPFREATALVTVEREGILDTYARELSGSEPTFTIPVKGSYAPNVFVSALVVRGRIGKVLPTALADLGKPAYKLGIVPMRVGWAEHELKVQVAADKPVYKVREQASVSVQVTRADGSALPAGAEVAIAAVDAGLLELMPNTSWDLLEAMMRERSLQVQTSTAQMQVIGKRHFGRKAFPHGGGGGRGGSRELFDTLLLWKARVTLDANGEARVQVPVNDSLTEFRIVAIASAGPGLFGTGKTSIRSSQDLMLMSGLPALVREGDRFHAGFTLRNTSAAPLQVDFGASVAADGGPAKALARQSVTLGAGQAQDVGWDYQVPDGAKSLAWNVDARAGGAGDKLRVSEKVVPAVPLHTMQATLLQLDMPQTMRVQIPADALPGRGGIVTSFSARLANEMPGVRDYMRDYPYTCFEQRTSVAVALRDADRWKSAVASLPSYLDSDGLVKYFPTMNEGSDTLTAYVLSVAQEAGFDIPDALKGRMLEGLQGFVEGRVVRGSALATADLAVRKMGALEAVSRSRSVAAASLESFAIEPNLWPTSAVIDWYLVLERSPALPNRDARLAQVQQILRARLNMQGTTMGFSTERSDDWWWLMASADVNANRLLLAMLDNPAWQTDMGRLARGTLGRQHKGRWQTTVANAWGVLALQKFSGKFEAQAVTGSSSAALAGAARKIDWGKSEEGGSVMLPWPKGAQDLALRHTGGGKPWATVQSVAAIPLTAPLSSGYRISKTIAPVEQKLKGVWSRGDVYRVHLDLEAQSDITWVVVDDPIPASASVLGSGLGRDSQIMTAGEQQRGWVQPVFQERGFEAFRAYFDFVPKGKWSVEYTVRLNNEGQFRLPATRVEAMYSPEMFGEAPNAPMAVAR